MSNPVFAGNDPAACDGIYPTTRDGLCHGCGGKGPHESRGPGANVGQLWDRLGAAFECYDERAKLAELTAAERNDLLACLGAAARAIDPGAVQRTEMLRDSLRAAREQRSKGGGS